MGGCQNCCVVGCKSRGKGVSYYKFPSRPWEQQRRKEWIGAVRRCNASGKIWEPTKYSVICSLHFDGGKKMEDPRLISYNPTIFPPCYKQKGPISKCDARLESKEDTADKIQYAEIQIIIKPELDLVSGCSSIGTQTEADNEWTLKDNVSTHYVWNDSLNHEASTQTYVALRQIPQNSKSKIIVVAKLPTVTKSKEDERNEINKVGFIGFSNKIEDLDMKQLTGVSLTVFHHILKFVGVIDQSQTSIYRTLSTENRLLLFLMKIKLGLAFSTIGLLFNVSSIIASGIFGSILDIVYENVKEWIKWPSRQEINQNGHCSFKNYPKCRAIIDFIEIRTDTSLVDQHVQINPSYSSGQIIKFLIASSPSGSITFVSKGYYAKTTNEFVIYDSGFINLLEHGDKIMATKDYPQIKSELLKKQCALVTPPFSFDPIPAALDVVEGSSIGDIQIDQAIQRLKMFKIIDQIDRELLNKIDKIMHVICAISK